jgi:hypothetical protein
LNRPRSPGQRSLAARAPWLIAFAFGLAWLWFRQCAQRDRIAGADPIALLFFNLGVEAGQLLFVAAVPHWSSIRVLRLSLPRWMDLVPPYAIGTIAMFWVIQRVAAFFGAENRRGQVMRLNCATAEKRRANYQRANRVDPGEDANMKRRWVVTTFLSAVASLCRFPALLKMPLKAISVRWTVDRRKGVCGKPPYSPYAAATFTARSSAIRICTRRLHLTPARSAPGSAPAKPCASRGERSWRRAGSRQAVPTAGFSGRRRPFDNMGFFPDLFAGKRTPRRPDRQEMVT